MASDTDLVTQQYESVVKSLFNSFFNHMTEAAALPNPQAAIAQAEQGFLTGISIARDARDRAQKLVIKSP
jgi:hypothetical protein